MPGYAEEGIEIDMLKFLLSIFDEWNWRGIMQTTTQEAVKSFMRAGIIIETRKGALH